MKSKRYLQELLDFYEAKEAREAKEAEEKNNARKALGKFIKETNKNTLGEESKIEFLM